MKVRVLTTGRADAEARRATSWWRENRQAAPYLFETELAKAIALLSEQPEVGHPFARPGFPKLRVMLLPRTRYHLTTNTTKTGERW